MDNKDLFYFDIHGHKAGVFPSLIKRVSSKKFPSDISIKKFKKTKVNGYIINAVGDFTKLLKLPLSSYKHTMKQIDKIIKNIEKEKVFIVSNIKQFIDRISDNEKFYILGIEGADFIENDINKIDEVYKKGIRVITLVHFNKNSVGIPCMGWNGKKIKITKNEDGLTDFGIEVVKKMNKMGIMVDIAHANEKTALDIIKFSKKPVICSHTGSKAILNFERYISDNIAKKIAENGGLIGLWLYYYKGKGIKDEEQLQLHLKHFKNLVGAKHLSIGTDINAVPRNMEGYKNLFDIDIILKNLNKAGFSEDEIEMIAGRNFKDLFIEVLSL